jgi:transposase
VIVVYGGDWFLDHPGTPMIPKLTKEQFRQVYDQGLDATFALFDALQQAVESLEKRVAHLEGILAKNSGNSSKPPSSDGFVRPPKSLRERSGRKPGGQKGHEGTTLRQTENPDHVIEHRCQGDCTCGKSLLKAEVVEYEKRQVVDIPVIKATVTEHRALTLLCACGREHTAGFPTGIVAPVQYGSGVKALALYLMAHQLVPMERTQQMLRDIVGVPLSQGTLTTIAQQGYAGLEKTEETIKEQIVASPVVHADETGCDVSKDLWWIHSLGTLEYTWYFCDEKRGKDAVDVSELLSRYGGRLVHDGWKSYLHYLCKHALCNAHHLRELVFIDEHLKEAWAQKMKKLLLDIKDAVEEAVGANRKSLVRKLQKRYRRIYLAILREGYAVQPPPIKRRVGQRGKLKQPPGKNLLDRLKHHIDDVLAFMYDFSVPFTNNLAERDLRMVKVKLKVSGCFRTSKGARIFCRIRSFMSTLRKQDLNILDYTKRIFDQNAANVCLIPV